MILCVAIVVTPHAVSVLCIGVNVSRIAVTGSLSIVPIADYCDDNSDYSRIVKPLPVLLPCSQRINTVFSAAGERNNSKGSILLYPIF
jgi:hypothetical protein